MSFGRGNPAKTATPGAKQANDEDMPLYPKAAAKKQQPGKGKKAKAK